MRNKIASSSRVKGVIGDLVAAGYTFGNWTEDGPYDSPKLEMNRHNGNSIFVAVESDSIHITPWGPGAEIAYVEFKDVAAFLA